MSDRLKRRETELSSYVKSANQVREVVKRYGSTAEAAEALQVSEAWLWNRLPCDDREPAK